jgi:hypothetical protein
MCCLQSCNPSIIENLKTTSTFFYVLFRKILFQPLRANSPDLTSSCSTLLLNINNQRTRSTLNNSTAHHVRSHHCEFATRVSIMLGASSLLHEKPRIPSAPCSRIQTGGALGDAGDGQQRADDGTHRVDKRVRSSGRGSWAADERLQSAGEVPHAPCGCGPAPTSDLTQ